ncbi:MAG: D-aminoacylase [Blastocatellia bacterium]|nr:D-aminoacylase [Blastocatellia bacterium]
MKIRLALAGFVICAIWSLPVLLSSQTQHAQAKDFDLLIKNGRIVDGTNNPWFVADIAIKNGRIADIGHFAETRAARVIDAQNHIVAPGFIDVHTHIEGGITRLPTAENFLQMGVTSVVTGNCGSSELPLGDWFQNLEKTGVSINIASLVGHNTIRRAGMNGDFDRAPTAGELQRMRDLTAQAMREGAVGLSTGLEYVPGTYAKTDEIVSLAKIAAEHGGLYATHMRNEDVTVEQSIKESLEVGAQANCPVQISHFKISSRSRWGASAITIKMVEEARARGQQVTVDQYLYPASSTGIGILFPSWIFADGKLNERLQDKATRERIIREMLEKANKGGFQDFSFAYVASHRANPNFNGKNIAEITSMTRKESTITAQAEQAIEILKTGGASMVLQKMSEADVERIFRQPFTMVASDAGVIDVASDSIPHPRGFGNNARVLAEYVRKRNVVSLAEAIRKMTSLPAQTFKLWDRGLLRPGMAADVVIFDEKVVADLANFQQPKQYATGFGYVLVNGQVIIENGKHTGARAGQILRGKTHHR